MAIPKTKLRPPILRQPIVYRPRLTQSFIERRPLTIVSAPAGSGKTTLALEWLAHAPTRVAWLSLDPDDNDPIRFINGVMTALKTAGLKLQVSRGHRDVKTILTDLINQIEDQEPVTLVLDDYHLISEPSVHGSMQYLLEHIPASLQVVLVTRETPPLPLARFRARNQLREFHLEDLRFTNDETKLFLNQIMGLSLSTAEVESILNHTQGWVAGLQMAGLSLQSSPRQPIPNRNERQFITEYFLTEVFNHQPEDVQTFLLYTSIPEKFSTAQSRSLYGSHSAKLIAYLEKANLFISTVDKWYQYHPLFREFLQGRLQSTHPEKVSSLQDKTRMWLEQNGYPAEAIPHAFAGNDHETAARLIASLAPDYLKRGELVTLRRWMDKLPESVIWKFPRLCLTQIWLMLDSNMQKEAQVYLDKLGKYLEKNIKSEFLILRAIHAAMSQQPDLAMKFIKQAQRTKDAKDPFLRTYFLFGLGAAQKMALNLFQSEQSFRRSLTLAHEDGNIFIVLSALANLIDVLYLRGRLADAEIACHEALQKYKANIPESCDWYWTLTRIAYQRNQLKSGLEYANRSIELCLETQQTAIHTRVLLQRAQIHYAMGNRDEAQADLQSADMLTRTVGDTNILRSITRQRILFAIREGELDAARQWQSTLSEPESASYPFYSSFIQGKFQLAERDYRQAQVSFEETLTLLNGRDLAAIRIETLIALGICAKARNQNTKATRLISDAIKLAESGGILRPFIEARADISDLLPRSGHGRFSRMLDRADRNGTQAEDSGLTRREKEILQLLAVGMSNQEMAERLVIAEGTLKRHVANLYQKLGVHNRTQAIRQFDRLK